MRLLSSLTLSLAWSQLKRKPGLRLVALVSLSALMVMNGFLFLTVDGLSRSMRGVQDSQFATVFFDPTLDSESLNRAVVALEHTSGVDQVDVISKEVILDRLSRYFPSLKQEVGDLENVDAGVLPKVAKVRLAGSKISGGLGSTERSGELDLEESDDLTARLSQIPGVDSVELNSLRFSGVMKALSGLRFVIFALMLGSTFALGSVLLSHYKLNAQLGQATQNVLSSLGARRWKILVPFAIEGLFEGLLIGAASGGLFYLSGNLFQDRFIAIGKTLGYVIQRQDLRPIVFMLLSVSLGLGLTGSLWIFGKIKKANSI